MKFDLIIDTIPFNHDINNLYINLPKLITGTLWIIGFFFTMAANFDQINRKRRSIRSSDCSSLLDSQELINFCVKNNIYPNIKVIPIQKINDTHQELVTSKIRYCYVVNMSTLHDSN